MPVSQKSPGSPARKPGKRRRREQAIPAAEPAGPPPLRWSLLPDASSTRQALAAILALSLGLRLYHLLSIPMAGDESNYLRWTEIILHQKEWFVSLLDGKQPLSYWLYALARALWPGDPLYSARLVSVLSGALSTLGVCAIARRLAGDAAGLLAACLYGFLPYALLYDRLAYTESLVNLAGIAIVYTSLVCFESPTWKRALIPGLALGLGYFTKSTALLFAFFPLLAALWLAHGRRSRLPLPVAAAYGVALVFPLLAWLAEPRAPTMPTESLIFHHTSFFVPPAELLRHPLAVAPANLRLLAAYLRVYLTVPLALATLAALAWLACKRSAGALVIFSACALPLLVQVFVLQKMFPSRYPFPHIWPCCVVVGMAAAALPWPANRNVKIVAGAILAVAVAGPAVRQAWGVVRAPREHLYQDDALTFLGSGPAAGFGIREAADYLLAEARQGPLTLFTDPVWGPPADSLFVYLNQRSGIRVYEAWWTTISPHYPI
ncbi:MAG TPA: glycosyltransferase family 39 protein, partial [Bryobacterales bacterium]|nr:glycosyltransferase family 39 protein [Bryobacterales bacterium]